MLTRSARASGLRRWPGRGGLRPAGGTRGVGRNQRGDDESRRIDGFQAQCEPAGVGALGRLVVRPRLVVGVGEFELDLLGRIIDQFGLFRGAAAAEAVAGQKQAGDQEQERQSTGDAEPDALAVSQEDLFEIDLVRHCSRPHHSSRQAAKAQLAGGPASSRPWTKAGWRPAPHFENKLHLLAPGRPGTPPVVVAVGGGLGGSSLVERGNAVDVVSSTRLAVSWAEDLARGVGGASRSSSRSSGSSGPTAAAPTAAAKTHTAAAGGTRRRRRGPPGRQDRRGRRNRGP